MGIHVNRQFICSLLHQYYHNKQKHHKFCYFCSCKSLEYLLDEMNRWNFYDLNQFHDKWFIIFHKKNKKITLFPVKYYSDFNVKEPYQTSEDIAGHDVFAAETKTFLPKSVDSISLEMIWAIPSGFYGKLFPRSGILREHLVTVDAGVIDSDFIVKVAALLFNDHPEKTFTVRAGDRIA